MAPQMAIRGNNRRTANSPKLAAGPQRIQAAVFQGGIRSDTIFAPRIPMVTSEIELPNSLTAATWPSS